MAPLPSSRPAAAALAALLAVAGASPSPPALRGGRGLSGEPSVTTPEPSEPAPSPGAWPPRNWCAQFETEDECGSGLAAETCRWSCWSAGSGTGRPNYDTARCWPKEEGWGCAYNGGGRYCARDGEWDCPARWGSGQPDNGCYCWYSYRGAMDCCACPAVPNCAGREFVSCGGTAAGGSVDHLVASMCSRCEEGFEPSEDQTECLPLATTAGPTTAGPAISSPATSAPATSPPATSGAATSPPATSAPAASAPATSAPAASSPATSAPATSSPATSLGKGGDLDNESIDVCDIGHFERVDCGFWNITEEECSERDCCWESGPLPNPHNVAWCYKRSDAPTPPPRNECSAQKMEERLDCGVWGTSEAECLELGCCWAGGPRPNPSNHPWCFHPSHDSNSSVDVADDAADDDADGAAANKSADDADGTAEDDKIISATGSGDGDEDDDSVESNSETDKGSTTEGHTGASVSGDADDDDHSSKDRPCPPVLHCLSLKYVTCHEVVTVGSSGGDDDDEDRRISMCSRCKEGFEPNEKQTECAAILTTETTTNAAETFTTNAAETFPNDADESDRSGINGSMPSNSSEDAVGENGTEEDGSSGNDDEIANSSEDAVGENGTEENGSSGKDDDIANSSDEAVGDNGAGANISSGGNGEVVDEEGVCDLHYNKTRDCGFWGITEDECMELGCCWGDGPFPNPDNHPWCYHRRDAPRLPQHTSCGKSMPLKERRDCGFWGISEEQCLDLGCCWSDSPRPNPLHVPLCFHRADDVGGDDHGAGEGRDDGAGEVGNPTDAEEHDDIGETEPGAGEKHKDVGVQ